MKYEIYKILGKSLRMALLGALGMIFFTKEACDLISNQMYIESSISFLMIVFAAFIIGESHKMFKSEINELNAIRQAEINNKIDQLHK